MKVAVACDHAGFPLKETVMVEMESEATVELPLSEVSY